MHKDYLFMKLMEKLSCGYNSFPKAMAFNRESKSFWIYTCLLIILAVGADARRNEESAPRITEHPSSQSVRKNSPATLNCRAEGYPTPELHWLKDGQPLETKDPGHLTDLSTGALFFLRVIPRIDIGVYQCIATNSLGVAYSNNASLEIAYLRGDFRQEPSDTMALLGEAVVLECSPPRGHPEPEVSWERNGETVVEDGVRVRILTDGNLVISQPKSSDIGNYVCVATNSEGTKRSAPGRLIINSRPAFTAVPFDTLAIPGETITLPCMAEGEPTPTIRWVKQGGSLPLNRNTMLSDSSLRISNAENSDSGTYVCTAQNTWGEKSVEAIVTVSSAPMFTRVPVDRTVVVGQDAFFLCQATGLPAPSIYWKERGAKPLMFPGDRTEHFEVTNDGRLHLFSVTRENEGYYVCSAMSGRGSVEDSAYLRVLDDNLPLPPIIHIGPSNQTLVEGSPAQLVCQAEGRSQPSIDWLKDGAPLQLVGTRVTLDGSGTLKFSSLTPDDAGLYTCSAANNVGATKWSASLQVIRRAFAESGTVHEAPSVTQLPQAPGFPIVDNKTRTTMRLTWPSARPQSDRTVSLSGYRIEYFTPDNIKGWTVAAEGIQGNSYEVRNLEAGFQYVFMVRGINQHGYGPPSPVSIAANTPTGTHRGEIPGPNAAPGVTTPPTEGAESRDILQDKLDNCGVYIKRVQVLGTQGINVTWQIVRNGDYIDGYYLKVTPQVKSQGIFEMNRVVNDKTAVQGGLQPWTEYGITVQPYHGAWHRGKESKKVVIRTAQDVPRAPPTSIKARQNGSTAIKVSWRPPTPNQVPGIIAGYHVFCLSENPPHHPNITTRNNRTLEIAVPNLRPGAQYGVKVAAYTIAGMGPFSDIVYVTLPPGPDDPEKRGSGEDGRDSVGGGMDILSEPWFYAAVALALLFVVTSIFLLFWRRHKKKPCSPVGNVMISKDNVTVQNMSARPTQLNGSAHPEGETTWTSNCPPHSHNQQGCMGNCCTGNGSSGDDTLEKNKPPPSKWPNGAPPVWLQEVYNPKYPSHLQSQVSKETHLTHDSQSSSGFGSSFPTLSTFHGMMMHPSSPEYAVVENEAEMDEELSIHAGSTLPIIPSPGSGRPPPQYNQHLHFPHHQMSDDPEPYASATLVQPPNRMEYPARRQNCSDNSSEWSGSWQSNREGRRPGRMVKPGGHGSGHGSPRGWHGPYDGPPAVPDRDLGYSDQGSHYSRCSSGSKQCRHPPHAGTPGRQQTQRNWAEFLPPPPEQPPTDIDSPGGSLPPSHPGSIKSSFYRRGSSPNQQANAYVQINPGACEDCEAAAAAAERQCPPVPPRHHQQSPLLNQPLSGNNSPVPIYPPPLLPQQPCRTEIPGPGSHFQPINSSLSPPPGDSPSHKRGVHKLTKTPPPIQNTTVGSMTPEYGGGNKQTVIPLQSGPGSPGRGSQQQHQQSIASHRVFEDPRHAQIGQELLKYMTRNELEAMSEEAPYAPMEMTLQNTEGSKSVTHPSLCEVETTELTSLDSKDRDMDTASNCTGSMLAYGSSSNGSRRNSNVSSSSDGSFFAETDFASAVAAAAHNAGVSVMQRDTPLSSQHLLREDTV